MRSIAFPDQHDGRGQQERYVLDSTPSVRLSSWAIVFLIFGLAGGAAYLVVDRADRAAPAVDATDATSTPSSSPTGQPGTPQEPAAVPSVAAAGTTEAPTVESSSPGPDETAPPQPPRSTITDGGSVDALVRESLAASASGEHQAALASAEAAVALEPDDAQALFAQGRAQYELKQLEAAERALVRSIDIDPANADVRNQLGLVYLEQGRSREALQAFQDAATLAPDHEAIRRNLERARERISIETTSELSR